MVNKHEDIRKFLENIPDTFDILEEGIDIQTQKEYLTYLHSFDHGRPTDEKTLQISSILFSPETIQSGKKKALALLAHLGTIIAY